MSRILVVEDDRRTAELLVELLGMAGFVAASVPYGEDAVERMHDAPYNLVLLDVNLPGMDGFDTCRALRAHSAVPIIMLTARGEPGDRVDGLETGADDYVPKPFDPRELVARVRAVLRRAPAGSDLSVADGHLRLEPAARRAWLDGELLDLTSTEFDLLRILASRPGQVVERTRLMELARGEAYGAFDRSIDVHVSSIRRKLGDDPRKPRFIQTVRGVGYLFVAAT